MKGYGILLIAFLALCLQGCAISSTYVSTIGLRDKYQIIESSQIDKKATIVYEHKLIPNGGGHAMLFIPYKSIVSDSEKIILSKRPYQEGDRPDYIRYRKWYGYPAQLLQVVAIPTDVVIGVSAGIGLVIWYPISLITS